MRDSLQASSNTILIRRKMFRSLSLSPPILFYILTHIVNTRRLRLTAVQVKINVPGWFDLPENAGIRVHHIDETRVRPVQFRVPVYRGEQRQRRIQAGQSVEQNAGPLAHNVAGKAGHMGAQTEADQMHALEARRRLRRIRWPQKGFCRGTTKRGPQADQKGAEAFARLACVQHGGRIAGQLGQFAPVGDYDVGVVAREVCWKRV